MILKIWNNNHLIVLVLSLLFAACTGDYGQEKEVFNNEEAQIFFDDFTYNDVDDFTKSGWKIRNEPGHPGILGATWWVEGVSFHNDMDDTKNGTMRLTSQTDSSGKNTRHTQVCHARKYHEGTYATRVFFRDKPTFGPDGDEVIQTFYAISPLKAPMDQNYSEADFEYLPNGGWGTGEASAMWATSWETFQLEPWTKVNEYSRLEGSFAGWHTLVKTISDNKIRYFVDGQLFAEHSEKVYPEVAMSINFNLWFMPESTEGSASASPNGPVTSQELRQYQQDVDWVFHQADVALTTEQVEKKVENFRNGKVQHIDGVSSRSLPSPCGL